MARKPTEFVQFKLRIREGLRRKIERAAEKKAHSANTEAVERIEQTFEEEELWEARYKDMEERQDEMDERHARWIEEKAREEAEHKAALRDSRLLSMMLGNNDNVELIRVFIHYIHQHSDWTSSDENRKALADAIHTFLLGANDVFQGQIK
jgi:hypothetical protein